MNKNLIFGFVYLLLMISLILISGFLFMQLGESKEQNKQLNNELDNRVIQYNHLFETYKTTYNNIVECEDNINNLTIQQQITLKDLKQCEDDLENFECEETGFNCSVIKYSHGCEDVPDSFIYNKMSHYPCYWMFREEYPVYGSFLDVGTICATQRTGWEMACLCTEEMAGDVYAEYIE